MESFHVLHCLKVQILIVLSVFTLLVVSDTPLPPMDDLLTGHVQIKRDSVPSEVLPCLAETALATSSDCPFKQSQWNNMHCLNNSFGMYTNKNKFVNFGADPLGIVFPTLFFNPFSSYSECSESGSGGSDEKLERIEALLKVNAEASMNITLLGQLLRELQRDKDRREQELIDMRQKNLELKGQIHIFKMRAERLEEVHQECTTSSVAQRNMSSIALRAAQEHITQLKLENKLFMVTNSKCLSELKSTQELLIKTQDQSHETEIELTRCSVSLTSSQESEAEVRKALVEEEEEHSNHLQEHQEERKSLISEKQNVQAAYAACDASLKDIRNAYEQYKQNYEKCLEDAGRTNVQLHLCTSALNLCRGNHSFAANAGELCERDRKNCLNEASRLRESLTMCENNTKATSETVKLLKAREHESAVRIASIQSELENAKRLKDEFSGEVQKLKAKLEKERSAYSDAHAEARACALDLVTAEASLRASSDRAGDLSATLDELRSKYTTLISKKFHVDTQLSGLAERCNLLKINHVKCQDMLNDASSSVEKLVQTETKCQKQLSNVTTSLSIVELQRNECLGKHHTSVKQIDQWRARYEEIDGELTTSNLRLVNCTSRYSLLTSRFNSLEEEANEVQTLNINLHDRLNTTLESLASMTKSNTELRKVLATQTQINTALDKQLIELQASLDVEKNANRNCLQKLHDSKSEVATLVHKISALTDASAALKAELNQCSEDLNATQVGLQEQRRIHAELEQRLQKVQSDLKMATSLHISTQAEMKTLERQLNLCRGNHSESVSESLAWEQQLIQCQKELTDEKADCLRKMEQLEERYTGCQSDLNRVTESLNANVLANQRCQTEKATLKEQFETLTRSYQASTQQITLLRHRLSSLEVVIQKLQGDSRTFKSRVTMLTRQHDLTRDQLTRCREEKEKQQLQLTDVSEELEKCHSSSLMAQSSPAGGDCPYSDQGVYVSTSFGCLLVTRSSGSQQELQTLCGHQAGGELLDRYFARMSKVQEVLPQLLAASHVSPAAAWLSASIGADGHRHCQDLKLQSVGGVFAVHDRPCSDRLPGLCVTKQDIITDSMEYNISYGSTQSLTEFDQSMINLFTV